jgi:aspartate dehydrogenase
MALKTAIAGLGTIGMPVARALQRGVPGIELVAVVSRRRDVAERRLAEAGIKVPVVSTTQMVELAEIVVECAPAKEFRSLAEPVLKAGRTLVTVSGAALLEAFDLVDLAKRYNGRINLVTGALLGLDAVRAATEGDVRYVRMISRKPPLSLRAVSQRISTSRRRYRSPASGPTKPNSKSGPIRR